MISSEEEQTVKSTSTLIQDTHSINNQEGLIPSYGSTEDSSSSDHIKTVTKSKCTHYFHIMLSLRIEPVMFLFTFSFVLSTTCLSNLMMDKGCRYHYNYSTYICDNLHNNSFKNESDTVEVLANNYTLYLNLLTPIGAFVMLYLASWSDMYGRKPLLVAGLLGFLINDIGIILCTVYFDSDLGFIIISNLPNQLTGGYISVMMIIYSHISEVSTVEFRALKYTFLQISASLAVTLGALAAGQLYKFYGYLGVFITTAGVRILAILWVVFLVPETRGLDVQIGWKKKLKNLFSSQNFTDSLRTCLKKREDSGRCKLWLLLLSSCSLVLTYEVYTSIAYVYTHHMYKWDPTTYSEYWAIFCFSELIVFFFCSFIFIKVFKFSDSLIGIIGSISIIAKNVFLAFAIHVWLYFMSNIFGFLNGMGNLAVRSLISKLVKEEELGRVFTILATCENIVPLLGSAVIANIFDATIKVFPGACYLAESLFLLLPLGTFSYIFNRQKYNNQHLGSAVSVEN